MRTERTLRTDGGASPHEKSPERCLSLTVAGPWGHFRRVDGNTIKATYRLPPRTTVAGLLAAIAGYERDGYYDVFGRGRSGIAIQPVGGQAAGGVGEQESAIRTMNLPENSLTTSNEGMKAVNSRGKVSIRYPNPATDRQRINYEVLVNPAYRFDIWLADDAAYDRLHDRLADGRSEYVPSLGLSEFLASVTFHGEFALTPSGEIDGPVAVDSALPNPEGIVPAPGRPHGTERSPGDMERTIRAGEFAGRKTTKFLRWAYSRDGEPLRAGGVDAYEVDGRTVVFS
ncbi:type I-B CRISPR-associated protein Cas5b [Halococcus sp. AFM35]|uniref:type I-B CRISPR-associated protein Cas5b n=1 Tax=Halococcus sp. AFM35 TaxID=3421653 RepID=UPI003EC0B81A